MSKPARRSRRRKNKTSTAQIPPQELSEDNNFKERNSSKDLEKCQTLQKIYSIARSESLGRYLVSSRNINAGEMIIDGEPPLVVGPIQQSDPLCLGCYVSLSYYNHRCKKCNWPLCNPSCSGLFVRYGHLETECDILSTIPFDKELQQDKLNVNNCIVPLRCLLLKENSKPEWKILTGLESHNKIRQKISIIWQQNENTVVKKLEKYFDPQEIHTICGILEVNCFEVTRTETSLRALFPKAALMSHNCVPNTIHTNDDEFNLRVRASVSIQIGEPLTISYSYTLQGTAKRRAHIKETKFFDCNCDRCSDSTELGTNLSTVVCPNCNHPTLTSSSPLRESPSWMCNNKKCSNITVTQMYVDALINKYENSLKSLPENSVENYEKWIREASIVFHKNHYLISGVKYTLSLLYGKTEGFMLHDMDDNLLQRKIKICEELLEISNIIEPGLSKLRGILLYELHAPIMMLLNRRQKTRLPFRRQLKHSLLRVVACLQESSDILQFESENTIDGKIGRAAKEALVSVLQWKDELGSLA